MSALATLQQQFLGGLLEGDGRAAGSILGTAQFSVDQRLAVYGNAYRRRLVEALASIYERCARALGEGDFDALALAYVEEHPPTDRMLGRYGAGLPDWLRARDPALAVLAGVATIDAGLRRAFDAADAAPINRAALLSLPAQDWASVRFTWVPALTVGRVETAAVERWREPARADHALDDAPATSAASASTAIAFWRRDGQTFFRSMGPGEALLLARLRDGAHLAEACADAAAPIPLEVAVPALLAWIDEGWVAGLAPASDD